MRFARDKKINILTLVLSEKKILNETKNHNPPPPLQVKWSVPNQMYILYIWVEANQCFCIVYNCIALNIHLSRGESHSLVGALWS